MAKPVDKRVFIHKVDTDGNITAVNDEWVEFALENGAPELAHEAMVGRAIWEFMEGMETSHISRLLTGQGQARRQRLEPSLQVPRIASTWVELDDSVKKLDLFSSASLQQLTHGMCQDCSKPSSREDKGIAACGFKRPENFNS